MKVVIYVRVSSKEQVEGYSIGEQIERAKKYCEAMGWTIVEIFVDPGFSGGDTNRPGLAAMLRRIKDGGIDKVVVYKLDRLSRSQKDTLLLIEDEFLARNIDFVSMTENFDTSTPFGRAMVGILSVFAQLEREQIKERMGMGKEARAKEGKWGGGSSVPVGYDYDSATETLIVNEYEAMQIHEAIDLFLMGTPLRTIETIFRNKGYQYKGQGGKLQYWDPKRLRYVFGNKTYLGYISYHGEYYKGDHTPLIDEETFEKMQKILEQRKEQFKAYGVREGVPKSYLGGLLYCKRCGAKYTRQSGKKWKGNNPPLYYSCYSRCKKTKGMIKDPNCKNKNWKLPELDKIVLDEIRKLATDPNYFYDLKKDKPKTDEPNKVDIIEKKIEEIDNQISRFMDLYGVGTFTMEQVNEKVKPLNESRNGLIRELEALNAESGRLSEDDTQEIISTAQEILDGEDFTEIRSLIESLIFFIEIDEDDVYIHWRFA